MFRCKRCDYFKGYQEKCNCSKWVVWDSDGAGPSFPNNEIYSTDFSSAISKYLDKYSDSNTYLEYLIKCGVILCIVDSTNLEEISYVLVKLNDNKEYELDYNIKILKTVKFNDVDILSRDLIVGDYKIDAQVDARDTIVRKYVKNYDKLY